METSVLYRRADIVTKEEIDDLLEADLQKTFSNLSSFYPLV